MIRLAALTLAVALSAAYPAVAQRMSYGKAPLPGESGPADPSNVDYEQRLGEKLPLDLTLYDHHGQPISLREVAGGKPTVLVMAYFRCPRLCNEVMTDLLDALKEVRRKDPAFVAGGPFNFVVVTIDPKESPVTHARPRRQAFGHEYDGRTEDTPGVWFLSASHGQGTDLEDADRKIHELSTAVGFRYTLHQRGRDYEYHTDDGKWYTRDGRPLGERAKDYDYQHAPGAVFIAPDGTITRYLLGLKYDPTTVRRAIVEASAGTVGTLSDKVGFYCFAYDNVKGHYKPTMRVVGLAAAPFAVLVLFLAGRTIRRGMREQPLTPTLGATPPETTRG